MYGPGAIAFAYRPARKGITQITSERSALLVGNMLMTQGADGANRTTFRAVAKTCRPYVPVRDLGCSGVVSTGGLLGDERLADTDTSNVATSRCFIRSLHWGQILRRWLN